MHSVTRIKIKILDQWKNPDKVICPGAFAFFSEVVTWPRAWTDDVITGVIDHEKVETHDVGLN